MASKLNPFRNKSSPTTPGETETTTIGINLSRSTSNDATASASNNNNHQQPRSVGGNSDHQSNNSSNNSHFRALLEQFGGGNKSSIASTNNSNSNNNKYKNKKNYRSDNTTPPASVSSDNVKLETVDATTASSSMMSSSFRPPMIGRTKSAPIPPSPDKMNGAERSRAMSPPVRPPMHPMSQSNIAAAMSFNNNVNNSNNSSSRSSNNNNNNSSNALRRSHSNSITSHTGNRSRTSSLDSKSTTIRSVSNHSNGGGNATTNNNNNNIMMKSSMRTVLEQQASKYFLSYEKTKNSTNSTVLYKGVVEYTGLDKNATTMLGLEDGDSAGLIQFLEVGSDNDSDDDDDSDDDGSVDDEKCDENDVPPTQKSNDKKIITNPSSPIDSPTKSINAKQETIETSTYIDKLLERASEQLSIGKNSQALQSYRTAMKAAYANVISVKNQLVKVKQDQIKMQQSKSRANNGGATTNNNNNNNTTIQDQDIELTKQQEREFELLLLQVASRVADIHNNMGVVHEMDRQFRKAQSSYQDALDVYHNTCRRFEQTGDADVERTFRNVNRMVLACQSEKERKELHSRASKIAKRVDKEKSFDQRKRLLRDAVIMLQSVMEVESRTIGDSHPVVASTLIQMGKYHYEMREFDDSVFKIRRAVTILRDALGMNHPQVGKAVLLLASVYERQGLNVSPVGTNKDDLTLELYVDALDPLKATLTDVHPEVGFLYIKIGYLYSKKGDRNLSALAYKAALKAYGEPWSFQTGTVHPEVVSTWVRLTEHLTELKCWEEVLVTGRRALFLLRKAKITLYQDATLHTPADTEIQQSKSKTGKISPIQITCSTYYEALLTTLRCLGQAHTSQSQYELAKMACEESLHLSWEVALANSNNMESVDPLRPDINNALVPSLLRIIRALKRLGKKNGVNSEDREVCKIHTWLAMAEASEAESASGPPTVLEIPMAFVAGREI
eukprot:scaffold26860_cov62-Cyclotella_meneghiniana.AAC.4